MLTNFFTPTPPHDYAAATRADTGRFARFFRAMRTRGILLPPSQFEAWFVSAAHTDRDIDRTIRTAQDAFEEAR